MVHNPPVLVLDEPTAGVDVELRQQLWAYVRELNKAGVTVLLTTHYLEEAEELCDQIAIINQRQGHRLRADLTAGQPPRPQGSGHHGRRRFDGSTGGARRFRSAICWARGA